MSGLGKEIERRYGGSGCKCVHYRDLSPNCECENYSVSDHSPGLVQDNEVLVRILYSPHYINKETGEVTPAAFTDARKRGLSVRRKTHISEEDHRAKIEEKVAVDQSAGRNNDGFWRVIYTRCTALRNLKLDSGGGRAFCVYDTATEDDPSHADVCQAFELPPHTEGRSALNKKLRSQLFEAFVGKATDLATVYGTGQ